MQIRINEKCLGWIACFMAIGMFSSFIDQIQLNLSGTKGSVLMSSAVVVNCVFWVLYSLVKKPKDWPIFASNAIGVIVGLITALTAYF